MKQFKPSQWQQSPDSLDGKLSTVQLWHNGIMMTANLKIADARQMVTRGEVFVITGQAVSTCGTQ